MSEALNRQRSNANAGPGPMRGPMGAMGRPVEKAKDFKGTFSRFLTYFAPQKYKLIIVLATATLGIVFKAL